MNREPLSHTEIRQIVRRVQAGHDRRDIAADYGITRSTISNYMRRYGLSHGLHTERGTSQRTDRDWMVAGRCIDELSGLPKRDEVTGKWFTDMHVDEQKRICRGCEVRLQCLEYGVSGPPVHVGQRNTDGIVFGGVTPRELARMQRERAKAAS